MALPDWIMPLLIVSEPVLLPVFPPDPGAGDCGRRWHLDTARSQGGDPRTRFLVVIPAHDEEAGIAADRPELPGDRVSPGLFEIVVIADNCTDDTAGVARSEGATVVERHDSTRRSKGYAIEYLIDQLQRSGRFDNLDALVVIDADTTVSRDLLLGFAAAIEAGEDWIQCFYAVSNPDASWRTRLMAYAFSLFNGVGRWGNPPWA